MKIAENITQLIGRTPLVRLNKIIRPDSAIVAAKLEQFNPLSSVKDRIALNMIEQAEKNGIINKDSIIVEPTSGNTGIGVSFVCTVKGYKVLLFMPENFSHERRKVMKTLGATLILTPASEGMPGAIKKAEEYCIENKNALMLQQFCNPANPEIHKKTTALEIWEDTDGKIDILICGVGTGGTITGCADFLKKLKPEIKIIAVEPNESACLSGNPRGSHIIQGIGAGFIPKVLNMDLIDDIIRVKGADAIEMFHRLANEEGIFAGISSAAAAKAAEITANLPENKGKLIVVIFPDSGDRYLSETWFENKT